MPDTALITDIGLNKIAAAAGNAFAVEITHVALGNGGGAAYEPDFEQTALQNEVIRRAIDQRVRIEARTWLVRASFAADIVPVMQVREIGFFDGDGDLIVIVAGAGFQPRSLGGFDYILEQPLTFDRAAEGVVVINAPDWELFDHAVLNLETHAIVAAEQWDQRIMIRDLQSAI
ncbi:Phage tail-collar fibre protein [Roseivivax halotolerans]|uniref:Phage tail-collar fibre protein n=1 Tax=Roseivivax halotolerans TaxID=93684 RepID=A0A1I5W471_9RHOB|nr:phage tail protein [Roseivivax halotolerans]SFQ14483.1 Phage tail-collar fibre protein [Roseivivax halotolerans]